MAVLAQVADDPAPGLAAAARDDDAHVSGPRRPPGSRGPWHPARPVVERRGALAVDEHVDVRRGSRARRRTAGRRSPASARRARRSPRRRSPPARSSGARRPGTRAASERGRMTAAIGLRRRPPRPTRSAAGSSAIGPGHALVRAAEELAGARPEVDADRLERVAGHRLAQDADIGVVLGQSGVATDPARAAVARPPHGGLRRRA